MSPEVLLAPDEHLTGDLVFDFNPGSNTLKHQTVPAGVLLCSARLC